MHQVAVCALAILVSILNLVPIELQRRMIDDAVTFGRLDLLVSLGAIYAVVVFGHKVAKGLLGLYQGWLSESTILYTRTHLLGLYFERAESRGAKPGEAVSIVNAEVDKLGGFVGEGPSQAVANLAMLIGVLGYMLIVEPGIALIGAGLLIPQVLLVPLLQRRLNVLIEERLSHLRELGEQIASGSAGDDDQSHERIHQIFSNRMRFFAWKFLMKGLLNLLNQLAPLGVLLWAGWLVIEGETTVGVVVAFISGFERMAGPVRGLLSVYRTAKHASVQHRLIAEWM
jgi:ABC-type multidrug transport system fused ATPase/permease subunit